MTNNYCCPTGLYSLPALPFRP